jgi:ATP-dependent helicase/nuclease subunit A
MTGLYIDGQAVKDAAFYGTALDPARNIVVQACAGSGKTWLLAARVIRLLLAGAAPESIVAITFTNKAAAEMQNRIFGWLEELASMHDAAQLRTRLIEYCVTAEELPHAIAQAPRLLERVLQAPQPLAIHTFHSWFLRLKGALPLTDAGAALGEIAPSPALLEADAWERFLATISRSEALTARYAWFVAQLGLESSRAALHVFIARRAEWLTYVEAHANPAEFASTALRKLHAEILARTPQKFLSAHRADLLAIAQAFGQETTTTAAKVGEALANALDPHCPPEQLGRYVAQALLTKEEALSGNLTKLRLLKQNSTLLAQCERVAHAAAQLLERDRAQKLIELHDAWYALGHVLTNAYSQEKAAQNAIDFADLELIIARVLQDESAAGSLQARLDARVAHLLVDEFQDTNPLQWRILRGWLAGYAQDTAKPSVFIVGDAKQSIYRFRRADPAVFSAAAQFFKTYFDARVLATQRTRRNATAINDFVNRLFEGPNGPWGPELPQHGPFAPQVTLAEAQGAVEVFDQVAAQEAAEPTLSRNPLTTPLAQAEDTALLIEARQVVGRLQNLARTAQAAGERWNWGQVLILVRARSSIAPVEMALREAGIAYESSRRGGLLEAPEVADMQALCTVLATPQADLALAQVLRSPMFDFTDADLIALWPPAPAQRGWEALQASANPRHREAFAYLVRWQQWAGTLPVHDLLDRIYGQHDVVRRYAAGTPPARRAVAVGNLVCMLELALDAHGGRYPSLPRFVQALESFTRVAGDEAPDEAAPIARETVLITTVHSAKGLERDVVVLFDAHRNWRGTAQSAGRALIVWPPQADAPVHFSYDFGPAKRTTARDAWAQDEESRQRIEAGALLYVAVTRAKQHLIISGNAKAKLNAQPSWWEVCAQAKAPVPWPQTGADTAPQEREGAVVRYPCMALPVVPWQPAARNFTDDDAALLGTVWHALLERLCPVSRPQRAAMRPALCQAFAIRHGLALDVLQTLFDEALALINDAQLAPLFEPHVKARAEWSLVSVQGELLRIDRAVWLNDALWILDFKRVPQGIDAATLPVEYGAQLARYAQTVQVLEHAAALRCAVLTQYQQLFEWDLQSQVFQARTGLH